VAAAEEEKVDPLAVEEEKVDPLAVEEERVDAAEIHYLNENGLINELNSFFMSWHIFYFALAVFDCHLQHFLGRN
jgi:hypothetical protein